MALTGFVIGLLSNDVDMHLNYILITYTKSVGILIGYVSISSGVNEL